MVVEVWFDVDGDVGVCSVSLEVVFLLAGRSRQVRLAYLSLGFYFLFPPF